MKEPILAKGWWIGTLLILALFGAAMFKHWLVHLPV